MIVCENQTPGGAGATQQKCDFGWMGWDSTVGSQPGHRARAGLAAQEPLGPGRAGLAQENEI